MRQAITAGRWAGAAVLSILVLCCGATAVRTQEADFKKSEDVVKLTATTDKPNKDGRQDITLTMQIAKGWHIYANPVGLEDLASVQTTVTASAKGKLADIKIDYPAGKEVQDKLVGNYLTYEDKAVIKVSVRRSQGDTSPVELTVRLQACCHIKGQEKCLLPGTLKVSVPQ